MPITDEYMKQMITKTKDYTIVILKAAQKRNEPEAEKIIWEHGRRNFSLREEGNSKSTKWFCLSYYFDHAGHRFSENLPIPDSNN